MRVAFVFRSAEPNRFSIEALYEQIHNELALLGHQVYKIYLSSRYPTINEIFRLRKLDVDIFHVTGDINYLSLFLPRKKTVLTLLDLGAYYSLKGLKKLIYGILWFRMPLSFLNNFVSISAETKSRVCSEFNVSCDQITLIPCCFDEKVDKAPKYFRAANKPPRVLQVGTAKNKNLLRVIRALSGVECTLVVIGLIDKKCKEEIDLLGIACENHVNSSRDQVISLYQSSSVVVFASLHEGFGLPIVESQAMWRPLVTSDLEPMKSVAGPGAILVDPYSVESIRSAILELLSSDESADEIVEKGIYNSRKYSPGEVTRLYLDLYAKIINET